MPFTAGFVSLFDCRRFRHVFAFFGGAVETRTFFVINVGLRINPNQAVASAIERELSEA